MSTQATLLKLRAKDAEDVQVISAVLQDALVPLCDMAFQQTDHSFVFVAQRLRREAGEGQVERICSALTIKGVASAQTHGIDWQQSDRILELLALVPDAVGRQLTLIFAGDARIRLDLNDWSAVVEDFGEGWPAQCNPCHESAPDAS